MESLLAQLATSLAAGRPVAYCRLVETRGSTPQKAGAMMLVFRDGEQAGTLGGGCVEAEVKRRALAALDDRSPLVARFLLDSDYGWDDGLICGGRMEVLIDPLDEAADVPYFARLRHHITSGSGCIEAIAFDPARSALPAPSCYLFARDGQLVAHRHGPLVAGDAPPIVRADLPSLDRRPRPSTTAGIAFLPVLARCRLVIVGGGHVGRAVGNLATELDFDVWVVDDRQEFVSKERFPRAERLIAGPMPDVVRDLDITPDTYCLIVTRGHHHDEKALLHLVDRGARYVGMIGSRRKIKLIFDDLEAEGVSPDALARVYAPVGIDIGSQTVPEIALSIMAEMVAHRNLGDEVPGRSLSEVAARS